MLANGRQSCLERIRVSRSESSDWTQVLLVCSLRDRNSDMVSCGEHAGPSDLVYDLQGHITVLVLASAHLNAMASVGSSFMQTLYSHSFDIAGTSSAARETTWLEQQPGRASAPANKLVDKALHERTPDTTRHQNTTMMDHFL
jgi:hypothetical protein